MAERAVLIAALSARALSQAAKSAGYRPLVVDCFGDQDLASTPDDTRVCPAHVKRGIRAKQLQDALTSLADACDVPIDGLILGAGFEDRPRLMERLSQKFQLLGPDPEMAHAVKDPSIFFPLLDKLSIAHPETQRAPPAEPGGWLRKRIGASGGLHIRPCKTLNPRRDTAKNASYYFQKQLTGTVISAFAVVGTQGTALALSEQWTSPTDTAPFRYGGAVSNPSLSDDLETTILETATSLCRAITLQGMVSIDFLVNAEGIHCLELNPRPGASIDVHEDADGSLFKAHMIACTGGDPVAYLQSHWAASAATAAAYLYADNGALTLGEVNWPDWAYDRPRAGTRIAAGQPLASVRAEADTAETARRICENRLAELNKLLYDGQIGKEQTQ